MKIERFRKFNTRDVYPGGRHDNDMCMAVKAGNRIFLRGQTGLDLNQKMVDPLDAGAQAGQAMENAKILLEEAGSDRSHILSATVYIRDMKDFAAMNEVWDAWVPEGHAPARACVEARMARPELLVEVTIIAAKKA